MKKLAGLLVVAGLLFLSGCKNEENKPEIGFLVKTLGNPFFIEMKDAVETYAAEHALYDKYLIDIQAGDSHSDVEGQESILRNWIEKEYDVICITPVAAENLLPTIADANRRGIKVIVVDTKLDEGAAREAGAVISSFVGSDNIKGGSLAAQFIMNHSPGSSPRIIFFEGVPDQETAQQRKKGFLDELETKGLRPVGSEVANWNKDEAFQRMSNLLAQKVQFDAVFASNDEMALGVIEAIEQAGVSAESKIIVGFDAIPEALKAINEKRLSATIRQQPRLMGETAVRSAVAIINNRPFEKLKLIEVEVVD